MRFHLPLVSWFFSLLVSATALSDSGTEKGSIAKVFERQCAQCHGADGQGSTDGYDKPIFGDQSINELAMLIERTMPEDDPERCVGEQANAMAAYIYREFYSLTARQQKGYVKPPRIELARLTVQQHRNAIADLVGHFTQNPSDTGELSGSIETPGLSAEYFQSRGMSKAHDLRLKRVDQRIAFDFGVGSPHADISADQFTVIWRGSLRVADSGYHEFRVRTENGARLYVNHDRPEDRKRLRDDSSVAGQDALIDAWVSSGKLREQSARVYLLGGRQYPIRLEFFKYKDETSSIELEWKRPRSVWSVLDHNHLVTDLSSRTFVVETPFPADDRSLGYERGSSVSLEWHAATNDAAIATASEVVDRLPILAGIGDDNSDRLKASSQFVMEFARHAFHRPLSEEEQQLLDQIVSTAETAENGVHRAVLLILKSPYFLYTNLPVDEAHRGFATASQLALSLWDSIPDGEILAAADSGEFETEEQVESAAKKMLADRRARAKMADFFRQWLEIEERDLSKDKEMFPDFDEAVIADLRFSLERFVEQVAWSRSSDYRDLLRAEYLILNDRLLRLYGPDSTAGRISPNPSEFRQFDFPNQRRAGVLTHPYLLSAFAYHNNTSPIHRGVFLTRNIVGRALKPPPEAVTFKDEAFSPDLTMREKITRLTRDTACMSCHSVINPLGFALESFDPLGRWRKETNAKPIETKATYVTADGEAVEFQDAVDIAKFAVESEDARKAFVAQLFHHMVKQAPAAFGPDTLSQLIDGFAEDEFNIQKLMIRIAMVAPSQPKTAPPAAKTQLDDNESTEAENSEDY